MDGLTSRPAGRPTESQTKHAHDALDSTNTGIRPRAGAHASRWLQQQQQQRQQHAAGAGARPAAPVVTGRAGAVVMMGAKDVTDEVCVCGGGGMEGLGIYVWVGGGGGVGDGGLVGRFTHILDICTHVCVQGSPTTATLTGEGGDGDAESAHGGGGACVGDCYTHTHSLSFLACHSL